MLLTTVFSLTGTKFHLLHYLKGADLVAVNVDICSHLLHCLKDVMTSLSLHDKDVMSCNIGHEILVMKYWSKN